MTTDITELAQSLKAAAEKATPGEWVYFPKNTSIEYDVGSDESQGSILYVDSGDFTQAQTDRNGEFIALANPANILALVEALEKAQQHIVRQEQILLNQDESLSIRRGELETAQQERDNWHTSFDNERFRADKLKAHIDDIEPIRASAEKLVRCKGRYHSEQNYRALAALFGANTPDLPPLEHENVHYADAAEMEIEALRQRIAELEESNAQVIQSRDHYKRMTEEGLKQLAEARTVKLPDLRQIVSGDRYVWSDGVYNYSQDVKVALAAAGIKVEVE
ncbi:ead/Ea22-like family protein [Klebsiella quasipneumoniae]|uniref:ead/Ea22-like family protein n=1 Tax=Klebsiella quasipneumoniae TaxID=1463165 RepID=UPI003397B4FB